MCLTLKAIENENYGIEFQLKVSRKVIKKVVAMFADNAEGLADGEDAMQNVAEMLTTHDELHTATEGNI